MSVARRAARTEIAGISVAAAQGVRPDPAHRVAALIAVMFGTVRAGSQSRFDLNASGVAFSLPPVVLPSSPVIWGLAGVCAFLGAIQLTREVRRAGPLVLASVVLIASCSAFLVWAASGRSMNLVGRPPGAR